MSRCYQVCSREKRINVAGIVGGINLRLIRCGLLGNLFTGKYRSVHRFFSLTSPNIMKNFNVKQ
jgi:hypothetical protein